MVGFLKHILGTAAQYMSRVLHILMMLQADKASSVDAGRRYTGRMWTKQQHKLVGLISICTSGALMLRLHKREMFSQLRLVPEWRRRIRHQLVGSQHARGAEVLAPLGGYCMS